MDPLEFNLIEKGFQIEFEAKISEENGSLDHRRVYPNIKQLYNSIKHLGFNEEIVIRLKYRENNTYVVTVYTKNSIDE